MSADTTEPSETFRSPKRTAVIYVPGLYHKAPENELMVVGRKLATALDRHAAEVRSVFVAEEGQTELGGRNIPICRITRRAHLKEDSGETIADLFLLSYRDDIMQWYRGKNSVARWLLAFLAFAFALLLACWRWFKPGHKLRTAAQRAHAVYAMMLIASIGVYLLILTTAGVKTVLELQGGSRDGSTALPTTNAIPSAAAGREQLEVTLPDTNLAATRVLNAAGSNLTSMSEDGIAGGLTGARQPRGRWEYSWRLVWSPLVWIFEPVVMFVRWATETAGRIFVLLTLLGIVSGAQVRDFIGRAAEETIALLFYLSLGLRKPQILGGFDSLVEQVLGSGAYDRCCVIGYSFGSILALDALFPPSEERAARAAAIEVFVTIGSPHDMILTYWPDYFNGRPPKHRAPPTWVNVYLPADILSSRFLRREQKEPVLKQRPTREATFTGMQPDERLGVIGWLTLLGLRSHAMYWAPDDDKERSCFELFVTDLFPSEFKQTTANSRGKKG